MELRIQILSIAVSAALLLVVLEMVRRKAFLERYALLWLLSALVMLGLSIWSGALESLAKLIGIAYPPNALGLCGTEETRMLAQRLALVEQQQRAESEQPPIASEELERKPIDVSAR